MSGPLCSKCHVKPRKPGQRWCLKCFARYMRKWRAQRVTVTRETFARLSAGTESSPN